MPRRSRPFGWSGRWDSLTAAHVAASAFDILAVLGLFVAGWRLWSPRMGVLFAFGWAANPFTAYSLNMNSNDALVGAAVAWLLAALSVPVVRGILLSVAGFTKLGPLALVPLFCVAARPVRHAGRVRRDHRGAAVDAGIRPPRADGLLGSHHRLPDRRA